MSFSSRVHHFKLVLLGDTAVGKSCLVVRFVRDEFFEYQEPTIGGNELRIFNKAPTKSWKLKRVYLTNLDRMSGFYFLFRIE